MLGGEGDGPGEFRTPTGVFETSDGDLAVSESYPPRVHWFDPSGTYVGSVSVDGPAEAAARSAPTLGQWSVLPDRTALVHVWSFPMPGDASGETHTLIRATHGVGGAGRPDTLVEWTVASLTADPGGEVKLIAARPQWAAGPDSVSWWTPADRYEMRAFGSAGEIVRTVVLEREPVRIDRALQSEIEQFFLRSAGSGPAAAAEMERVLERATWPERLPGVARLWVAWPSGRLFAAPYLPGLFREPPVMRLDVFEPDGGFAGWMDLPAGFSPRRFAADRVYGVLTDELGMEVAAHFRLAAPE